MSKKKTKRKTGRRRVTFLLDAQDAGEVILMGDFNQWHSGIHPMKKNKEGIWEKITLLFPGRYEYRFLVDGHWWNDTGNAQVCPNCFGTQNNIFIVSEK
jgi:1,4-alpha-glucan branching enzyme